MNPKNILTVGGGGAGGVTALQMANDLATLVMAGIGALDGRPGFDADPSVIDAGTRVVTVLCGCVVTVAGAALGRLVAHFIAPTEKETVS